MVHYGKRCDRENHIIVDLKRQNRLKVGTNKPKLL